MKRPAFVSTMTPGSKIDHDAPGLLDILGYMPFAVKLIAKLGAKGQLTVKDLLEARTVMHEVNIGS